MSANARRALVAVLVVTVGVAVLVAPFASSSPDGLEKVATDEGFADLADDQAFADGPLADYSVAGVGHERLATAAAGFLGVALILGITWGLSRLVRPRRPADGALAAGAEPATG
jgi:hypothetical protein